MREARGELRQGQGGHREATASVNQRVSSALLNMAPEENLNQNITFNPCSLLMSSSRRDRDEEANQWQVGKDDDEDQERLGVEVLRYVGQGGEVEVARRPIGPNLHSWTNNLETKPTCLRRRAMWTKCPTTCFIISTAKHQHGIENQLHALE